MDKIIIIAAVVAVIVIVGASFFLMGGSTKKTTVNEPTETVNGETEETEDNPVEEERPVVIHNNTNYTDAVFGQMLEEVTGDCTLYKHVAKNSYKCFGTAGTISVMATNEYRPYTNTSTAYFCKATPTGCKLYQKVDFQVF